MMISFGIFGYPRWGRTWMWLSRWSRTRGFGIQSPWAYRFVQTVVRHSIEANKELRTGKGNDRDTCLARTLSMLYYRLSLQAPCASWEFDTPDADVKQSAVALACNLLTGQTYGVQPLCKNVTYIWVIDINKAVFDDLQMFLNHRDPNRILIVEGIYQSRHSLRQWKKLRSDPSAGVSWDLYYCGIICFDLKMYKQYYKVMI